MYVVNGLGHKKLLTVEENPHERKVHCIRTALRLFDVQARAIG